MITAETDAIENLLRRLAKSLANMEFGHESTGGRALRAEGERFPCDFLREALRFLDPRTLVRDKVRDESCIFLTLRQRFASGYESARLYPRQASEPVLYALSESDNFVMEVFPEDLNMSEPQMLKSALHTKLDGRLLLRAASEGKQVSGLESVETQLRLLSLPELQNNECSSEALGDKNLSAEESDEAFLKAYLERNLTTILGLREKLLESLARCTPGITAQQLRRQLFSERNRNMFERMVPKLQQGSAFIAIGVGHLPGREGLLELLERGGYQITSIY